MATVDNSTLDRTSPSVTVVRSTSPDSIFAFTVTASDNLGVTFATTALSGALSSTIADTVRSAVTAYTKDFTLVVPRNRRARIAGHARHASGGRQRQPFQA